MERRPRIKIELSKADKVLEVLCFLLLVLLWSGTIAFFPKLPDQIPSHYNLAGQADDFSSKSGIFILPIVATILYTGITLLNRYPYIYNYTTPVTAENARSLYSSAVKLIRILKLAVVFILSSITALTYRTSLTNNDGPGAWFFPVAVAFMVLPTLFYLFRFSKERKNS